MRFRNPNKSARANRALTRVEVLVMIVVMVVMMGLVLPAMTRPSRCGQRMACASNLKQVGLSFRIFATDKNGLFPMNVSTNQGGSREYVRGGNAFRHFLAMSNELSTPKVLACKSDIRSWATNWGSLVPRSVSYFVGLDASKTESQTLLAGDRNITNGIVRAGQILVLRKNQPVGWTGEVHEHAGNVALVDGSVHQLTSQRLREQLKAAQKPYQRIAVP